MSNSHSSTVDREFSSVEAIRAQFPALRREIAGQGVGYFDAPGGTQVPTAVGQAMVRYLYQHNANTHWAYPSSAETDGLILDARAAVADLLFCRPEQVVFGQNMTTLTFHLARGLGRRFDKGDVVVITDLDHHANRAPWETLIAERGITIRSVRFDPRSGELDWNLLEQALTGRVRLVAVGAASNALGTIPDVTAICRLARERGALSFVDAVHYAPHVLVDVKQMGCDFLACSPYKFYGPHLGVLWGRGVLLEDVPVPRLAPAPSEIPERLETGTLSHEAIVGTTAAIEFLAGLAPSRPSRREALADAYFELHRRARLQFVQLWDGLRALPGIKLYGPPPDRPRTPTLSFTVAGRTSEQVAHHLATRGLFLSHGDFYAATVVERLKVEGLVRAGCACYTTDEEVERLVEGVRSISSD
jgi:cysteine desulfurase family protein (TIGR01976 family)